METAGVASAADPWRPIAQGCVSLSGSGGACTVSGAADGLWKVAVAPGGAHEYGIAHESRTILRFDRNPSTGALTQRGYPGVIGELHLDINDPLIVENTGRFVLTIRDGAATV